MKWGESAIHHEDDVEVWEQGVFRSVSSYVVLARKWRPAQFSDLVGQGHIVRTLMNAIRSNRLHQAYLLTGLRGIGKTSIARIFAKAVRCENATWDPVLKSCDQCASCKEIAAGSSVDVVEIDGASNNGVDAVREIRENVKYLPATGAKKIYIIDEVHMLTTAAFNALLKTLEEPPPHVIFIFATTEPHKIPATILSRVQRFDLRRITPAQVQTRLSEITQAEGIEADPAALALVARAGDGSVRDSLSLLDQVIAYSGQKITVPSVREAIGLIESQTVLGILRGVLARKPIEALALVEQAHQQGHDLKVLTRNLIEFSHGMILAKVGGHSSLAGFANEFSEEEGQEILALAELRSLEEIELIFQVLHHGLDWIARSPQPKIVLDVLLVKCATAEALISAHAAAPAPSSPKGGLTTERPLATPAPVKNLSSSGVKTAPVSAPSSVASTTPVSAEPAAAKVTAWNGTLEQGWEPFIDHVRKTRPLLASILEHGSCSVDSEGAVAVAFNAEDAYFRDQLQSRIYSEQLATLAKEFFGRMVRIRADVRDALAASSSEVRESLAAKRERERKEREANARTAVENHPIIREAKALFGGELGPIELTGTENGGTTHV